MKKFIKNCKNAKISIPCGGKKEETLAQVNKEFNHNTELVVRIGTYACERTFANNANKSAKYFNRAFVEELKKGTIIEVKIEKATE